MVASTPELHGEHGGCSHSSDLVRLSWGRLSGSLFLFPTPCHPSPWLVDGCHCR
ncbi:hypothetical protein RISK_001367 [Rhodopirellula islandica]|uniref:Uncharacterized protein n=1 Tax=Rhodopirellula islandica TaxID=595434 RepID=A0A0J1BJC1_RHOIS|nr:hypothetical protein RISK_001367 [Rhodopirellula islandica]